MEQMITPYHLKTGENAPQDFYKELESCTIEVLRQAQEKHYSCIDQYRQFMDEDISFTEALLDQLILGVLFNAYAARSANASMVKSKLLIMLFSLRKYSALKTTVDKIRGALACKWLEGKQHSVNPEMKSLRQVILFLTSCCEFNEELKRISKLYAWLKNINPEKADDHLNEMIDFASWFSAKTKSALGIYTINVNPFLKQHHEKYRNEEDYFFTGRSETEYHLNMVGAELMNRELQSGFQRAGQKVLLLPTCMASGNPCKALHEKEGLKCRHCRSDCLISQTASKMLRKGIKTVLISHSSGFSRWLKAYAVDKNTALIGVACVLNLLTGGFQMKRLGIQSQCIFLDHACCKKHWKHGVPASISLEGLSEMAEAKKVQNNRLINTHSIKK